MICLNRRYQFKFFKGCLLQNLLGPFLNTLIQMVDNSPNVSHEVNVRNDEKGRDKESMPKKELVGIRGNAKHTLCSYLKKRIIFKSQ